MSRCSDHSHFTSPNRHPEFIAGPTGLSLWAFACDLLTWNTLRTSVNARPWPTILPFSLLEMTIVLVISSILMSTLSLPFLKHTITMSQRRQTEKHQQEIVQALAAYVLRHHRLPCPARFVKGEAQGLASPMCIANTAVGVVPFKTLGLTSRIAKDGDGHYFTYAVEPDLTQTRHLEGEALLDDALFFCQAEGGFLRVLTQHNRSVCEEGHSLAFVLISHGTKGLGAFREDTRGGIQKVRSEALSVFEKVNADTSLTFYECPRSPVSKDPFRHKVYWTTRDNFMAFACQHPCKGR